MALCLSLSGSLSICSTIDPLTIKQACRTGQGKCCPAPGPQPPERAGWLWSMVQGDPSRCLCLFLLLCEEFACPLANKPVLQLRVRPAQTPRGCQLRASHLCLQCHWDLMVPETVPLRKQTLSYATLPLLKIGFNSRLLCIKCYEYSTLCPRNNLFSQICFVGKHLWTVGSTTLMVADGGQRILTPERYFNTGTHPASHVLLHDIIINTTFPVKLIENVVCCCCWLPVTPQTTYVTVPHDNMTAACVPATDVQDLHRLLVVGLGLGKHCDWLKITVLLL